MRGGSSIIVESFYAYFEMFLRDRQRLADIRKRMNLCPLGSGAMAGTTYPLDREYTASLLGFTGPTLNSMDSVADRDYLIEILSALSTMMMHLSRLSEEVIIWNSNEYQFVEIDDTYSTGSSIMPHKKNPDVFELTRAKCNKLQAMPQQIMLIMNNLPSGYFRDLQIIKEIFLPAFEELRDCLQMTTYIISKIQVNEHILDDARYDLMFSVEEVNRRAASGTPFRDAYKQVGLEIEAGQFVPVKEVQHTHEGSIGNLCNDRIAALMEEVLKDFHFERMTQAEQKLISGE